MKGYSGRKGYGAKNSRQKPYDGSKAVRPYRYDRNKDQDLPEVKHYTLTLGAQICSTTANVTNTLLVGQGTASTSSRIGNKIFLKNVEFAMDAKQQNSLIVPQQCIRLMLVYDKQANGAAPVIGDILESSDFLSQYTYDKRERFVILMDKCYTLGYQDKTNFWGTGNPIVEDRRTIRINRPTIYSGSTTAITDITTGSLWLVNVGTGTSPTAATVDYRIRVAYTDV